MKNLLHHAIRSLIDWAFRRKSPALILFRAGMGLIILLIGGWALQVSIPLRNGVFELTVIDSGATPRVIAYVIFILALSLVICGAIWEVTRYRHERARLQRKKVIVVEVRGLRNTSGNPLIDSIPPSFEGHREQLLIDLRQRVKENFIVDPSAALVQLMSLPVDLERRENGLDRKDISIVYGGLAPVPLTFLTGVQLGDEGKIHVLDWDRHIEAWRSLDADDDGKRFKISGIESIPKDSPEVAVLVSVSYAMQVDAIKRTVDHIPLIRLELEDGSPDCHWSEKKQQELGQQFLNTLISLQNFGIKTIHLFFAAQNSIVFRFGRLYDQRNLPELIVYQYQREMTPPYPWGVMMPVSRVNKAKIIKPMYGDECSAKSGPRTVKVSG